jgi:hypothetical protein
MIRYARTYSGLIKINQRTEINTTMMDILPTMNSLAFEIRLTSVSIDNRAFINISSPSSVSINSLALVSTSSLTSGISLVFMNNIAYMTQTLVSFSLAGEQTTTLESRTTTMICLDCSLDLFLQTELIEFNYYNRNISLYGHRLVITISEQIFGLAVFKRKRDSF